MNDFNIAIQSAMKKMTENGSIEEIIAEKLAETVKSIISDQLRPYSTFGKQLTEKIESGLSVDLDKVNLGEYNKALLDLVEDQLNNAVTGQAAEKLREDIRELFQIPQKEIKLSKVVEKFILESDDYDRDNADKIALIITPKENGFISVGLHPKSTDGYRSEEITSWTRCSLHMSIRITDTENSGKLTNVNDLSGLKGFKFMPTCMSGLSRLLYQMYCAGSVLVFDQGMNAEDYDTYYPDQDY